MAGMPRITTIILCSLSLSLAACGVSDPGAPDDDTTGEATAALGFPPGGPRPSITGMSPTWGPTGTAVTLTGNALSALACAGGPPLSTFGLFYGPAAVACSYDAATGAIHTSMPAGVTSSESFVIKEFFHQPPPCFITPCSGVRIVSLSNPFDYTVTLHVVNDTHYTLLSAAIDARSFSLAVAPGQSRDFDDPSYTPGSHHTASYGVGHDNVVLVGFDGSGNLGATTVNVDLIFTAADALTLHGMTDPNGVRCAQYSNLDPTNVLQITVCSTPTGAGSATGSFFSGSVPVTDGPNWTTNSDIFPFVLGGLIGTMNFLNETFRLHDPAHPLNDQLFHR
jgi:hypothetical protein